MSLPLLFGAALSFLLLLAVLAFLADRHSDRLAVWLDHPLTYVLSLTIYFTAWSYFGTGAAYRESGITYLSTDMGWSFTFLFGWPLLLKAIRFVKAHRVTTLPGALAIRYGSSALLTGLVVGVLVVSMLPYIALQLQAIAFAMRTLSLDGRGTAIGGMVLVWALIAVLFGILFGARQPDPTLRHPGIVAAMAVSGLVKLAAAAIVAGLAFWRFPHLLATVGPAGWPDMSLGTTPANSYFRWLLDFYSSMAGILVLPHVFHLAMVEGGSDRQVRVAKWAMPLYGWLTEVCLIPIALAGVAMGLMGPRFQQAILLVPTTPALQLLALIGGVAAATGMAVVTILALANMLLIDVLLPLWPGTLTRVGPFLLPLRWGLMLLIALASFGLWHLVRAPFLFRIGLLSFVAIAQLAPAFFLGLVWQRLQLKAVLWGLALSLVAWLYTALLPALAAVSPLMQAWVAHGPAGISWLRPHALLGIEGLPDSAHAILWCSLLNWGAVLFVALRQPLSAEADQRTRQLLSGVTPTRMGRPLQGPVSLSNLEEFLAPYLGAERARDEAERIRREEESSDGSPDLRSLRLRDRLERLLRGPLGPVSAKRVIDPLFPVSEEALVDVLEAYRQLEQLLQFRQEDLANRLRELSVLNQVSERLVAIEEPQGQLEAIVDLLSQGFHLDLVAAYLVEDHSLQRSAQRGFLRSDVPLTLVPGSPLETAMREHRPVTRASHPEAVDSMLDPLLAEGAQTAAYVPIMSGDKLLGVLACGVKSPTFYLSKDFLALLQAIANGLAMSLSAAQHRQRETMLKALYETTLANLSDAVRVSDDADRTIFVNDAYVALTQGPSRDYFLQTPFAEVYAALHIRKEDGQPLPLEEAATTRARLTRRFQHLHAVSMRTLGGQEVVLDVSCVPVLGRTGEVVQVVTVYRDITELYRLKQALEQRVADRTRELATERDRLKVALDDLQNLEKVKAAFINAVSHDLRIPLSGIIGYAEFIEDEVGGPISDEQRQFAHSIIEASSRMTSLLNELLDFARMEAGRFAVEPRVVDYEPLLQEALTTFRPPLDKKHLTLHVEIAPALRRILADPARVIQVLSNLLSNAIKFTPEGGRITVRACPDQEHLRVEVADTGVGIPTDALPHMFERFYQTKAGTQAGGSGLGLSISKSLIEAQGGQIGVESQEGKGSSFWFTLPFVAEPPSGS